MITVFSSGTQAAVIGTEHFLADVNTEGKFTGIVDVSAMVDGDVLELRAYQMTLTTGTPRVIDLIILYGAQPTDQLILEFGSNLKNELTDAQSLRYSLKQTKGTGRSYPWKVIDEQGTLSPAGIQALWDFLTASATTPGSIGKLLADDIDAAVSTRSSHSAADVWASATRTLTSFDNVRLEKNTALDNFMFFMRQSADHTSPATGLTVTAERSIDGGVFGACSNVVSEIGSGWYKINLAASDLNGDVIALKFTAVAADQRNLTVVTQV
ncbi:MAG TPA: hypothetical protein VIY48_16475 [Candidatus Paceibacterota bacterium]